MFGNEGNEGNVLFPGNFKQERQVLKQQMEALQQQMRCASQDDLPGLTLQFDTLLAQYRLYYDDEPFSPII